MGKKVKRSPVSIKRKISYKLIMLSQVQKLFFAAVLTIIILFYGYRVSLNDHNTEYARAFSEPNDGLEPSDPLSRVDRANLPAGSSPEGTINLDADPAAISVQEQPVLSQADQAGISSIQTQDIVSNNAFDSSPASINEPNSMAVQQSIEAVQNVENIGSLPLDESQQLNQVQSVSESPYAKEGFDLGDTVQAAPAQPVAPAQPQLYQQVPNAYNGISQPQMVVPQAVVNPPNDLPPPAEMPPEMAALLASINGDIADAKAREAAGQAPLEENQNA